MYTPARVPFFSQQNGADSVKTMQRYNSQPKTTIPKNR